MPPHVIRQFEVAEQSANLGFSGGLGCPCWLFTSTVAPSLPGQSVEDVRLSHSLRALMGALDRERSGPVMAALDACNARWGQNAVMPARAGLVSRRDRRDWNTKFEMRTPRYTTQVGELLITYA